MGVFGEGRSAVVTGAAGGIGLAVARACLGRGMRVTLADADGGRLGAAAAELAREAGGGSGGRVAQAVCDVRDPGSVEALREAALAAHGAVDLLVLNAGIARPNKPWEGRAAWEEVLGVNLWGVVNGLMAFVPGMLAAGAGTVVALGSKQGITNPPGNAAYNVSKAGVKALMEQLSWEFRQVGGARLSAHLLVPGFTWTPMTAGDRTEKPEGAWWPSQVAGRMIAGVEAGDFYIVCQDNEVDWETDRRRIAWGAGDVTEGRPALSRWHPDWAEAFEGFRGP